MPHVDLSKKLSDPIKVARLLYVSKPFLDGFEVRGAGKYTKESLQENYERASRLMKNKRIVGSLESYVAGHEEIKKHLHRLRSRVVILSPGISVDNSENMRPSYCGEDWVSERFRLSEEHLWMLNRLDQKWKKETGDYCYELEHLVFVYDSPFKIAPAIVKRVDVPVKATRVVSGLEETIESERPLVLTHPFPEIFDIVNRQLEETQVKTISNILLSKSLGQKILGQKGLYESIDLLFDTSAAKKAKLNYATMDAGLVKHLEEEIERSCPLNVQIGAQSLRNYLKLLQPSKVWANSSKSSYIVKFIERARGIDFDFVGGFGAGQGILRNADSQTAYLRECHPSAISILTNKIEQWVRREGMHTKIPDVRGMFEKGWPDCPVLGKMFACEYAQHCTNGEVGLPCEADVALTMAQQENLQILTKDAYDYGYKFCGIEAVFAYLNATDKEKVDFYLTNMKHLDKSLKKITDEVRIVPIELPKKLFTGKYHLRWSEHGSPLSRIIGKFTEEGRKKLIDENGLNVDLTLAVAGSTRHLLDLQQHCGRILQNNTLKCIGMKPAPRNNAYEGEVFYVFDGIIVRGHYDAPLATIAKKEGSEFSSMVGAVDLKRAQYTPYEQEKIMRQKFGYALSIRQMHGLDSKFLCGISVKRPFNIDFGKNPGEYRMPRLNINIVDSDKNNKTLIKIHEDLLESYQLQAMLLHNRSFMKPYDCSNYVDKCYNHKICEFLKGTVEKSGKSLIEILDDLKVMPQDWQAPSP